MLLNLAIAIKHENFNFFMALLGSDIGEYLLMLRFDHIGWNWNENQTETTGKLPLHENENMIWNKNVQTKSLN